MTILMMKAFGDFAEPYDINIAVGEEQKIQGICRVLNKFCKELLGSERDVKLSYYLNKDDVANELMCKLVEKGSKTA